MARAEAFARRIPLDAAYEDERLVSWDLVGSGYLHLGDAEGAARALGRIDRGGIEADFRLEFARWTAVHRDSQAGLRVLRETVERLPQIGQWCFDQEKLAHIVSFLLGEPYLRKMAEGLEPDERDIPLSFIGRPSTDAPIAASEANAVGKMEWLVSVSADAAKDTLARYLRYRHNDLKVRWLVYHATEGGLDDAEAETLVASDEFQIMEPPRQPNIHRNPSNLSPAEFADFLFARPVPLVEADEKLLQGEYHTWDDDPDKTRMVVLATQLFLDFEAIGRRYSQQQIEQGVWFLLSYPFSLGDCLDDEGVPLDLRLACLEAMIVPFRDYLQTTPDEDEGSFYMWWDLVGMMGPETVPAVRRVLEQILQMSGWACQEAALHGLNHLRPKEETFAIITRFLEEHAAGLEPKHLDYAELCRDCRAQ